MAFEVISSTEIEAGKPISNGLMTKIKNSLDANKASIDAATAVIPIIIQNDLYQRPREQLPVGSIMWGSISTTLNQATPITEFGGTDNGEWRLCNGTDVTGSDWAIAQSRTSLPDLRGRYLRMINHSSGTNPDGEETIDGNTAAKYLISAHTHSINHDHTDSWTVASSGHTHTVNSHTHDMGHIHQWIYVGTSSNTYSHQGSGANTGEWTTGVTQPTTGRSFQEYASGTINYSMTDYLPDNPSKYFTSGALTGVSGSVKTDTGAATPGTGGPSGTTNISIANHNDTSGGISTSGANETVPVSTHENCFIKINEDYIKTDSEWKMYYVGKSMTLTDVIVTPEDTLNGTGGTFTLDVQYSTGIDIGGTWTTLLSGGIASVTGGSGQSADSPTVDATALTVGQWLRIKVDSVATKQQGIHIYIAGEAS